MKRTLMYRAFVRLISFVGVVVTSACGPTTPPQTAPAEPAQSAPPEPSAAATSVIVDAGVEAAVAPPPPDAGEEAIDTGPPPCVYELRQTTPTVLVAMAAGRDRGPDARAPGAAKIAEEFKQRGVEVLGARDCITCGPICAAIGCNNRMIVLRLRREEARAQICAGMVQEAHPSDIRLSHSMACGVPGPHLACSTLP